MPGVDYEPQRNPNKVNQYKVDAAGEPANSRRQAVEPAPVVDQTALKVSDGCDVPLGDSGKMALFA
jgi:hypothetical protein